jgi:hypothetical protein
LSDVLNYHKGTKGTKLIFDRITGSAGFTGLMEQEVAENAEKK